MQPDKLTFEWPKAEIDRTEKINDREFLLQLGRDAEERGYAPEIARVFEDLIGLGYGVVIETEHTRYVYEPRSPGEGEKHSYTFQIRDINTFLGKLTQLKQAMKHAMIPWLHDKRVRDIFEDALLADFEHPEAFIDKVVYGLNDTRFNILEPNYQGACFPGTVTALDEDFLLEKQDTFPGMECPYEFRFSLTKDRYSGYAGALPAVRFITTDEHTARIYAIQLPHAPEEVTQQRREHLAKITPLLKDLWNGQWGEPPVSIISLAATLTLFSKYGITDVEFPLFLPGVARDYTVGRLSEPLSKEKEMEGERILERILKQKLSLLELLPKALGGIEITSYGEHDFTGRIKITGKLKSSNKLLQEVIDLIESAEVTEDSGRTYSPSHNIR